MAPEKLLLERSKIERLARFHISGKPPVISFLSRYNKVSMLRLLNEEGTWPMKPLEERAKISNLLRLPKLEGREEEVKLLRVRSR